ncbi:MAG: c-type cytochrome [Gemmatimonadota bacterium]|nr:c-type cytochrome [Gemmatimonadota bacterium]MDH4351739.1 c-type cytochrome [Gemmatimonadota bacterium]
MRPSLALFALSLTAGPAVAQFPPDSTENLQVLPKDTPVREVINTMRGFAIGLGVRCEHCHIGEAGEPLSTFDFVSDDMPAKDKAREMLRMVQQINGKWLAELPKRGTPAVEVQCVTCHRGQARPFMMEDLLAHVADSAGADAAVVRYRELRERFYGGFTYDFGPAPVISAAVSRLRAGSAPDALTLLALNAEYHPGDGPSAMVRGQAHLAVGDTTAAITQLERALELQPDNPQARRLLIRLKGGG